MTSHTVIKSPPLPTCVVLQYPILNHGEAVSSAHHVRGHDHGVGLPQVQRLVLGHAALGAEQGERGHALVRRTGEVVLDVDA